MLLRQLEQLITVSCHQLFVRGNHALTRFQGPGSEIQGNLRPADGLHYNIHLRIVLNIGKILHKTVLIGAVGKVPHIQDIFEPHQIVYAMVNEAPVGGKNLRHPRAYRAKSQNCYVNHSFFSLS